MKPFKGLVIRAGNELPRVVAFTTFEQVQEAVEGYVDRIEVPASIRKGLKIGRVDMLINEDGKLTLPVNAEATKLMADGLFWGDHVCGTVVLAGERNNAWQDVPDELVEAVLGRAKALGFPGVIDADGVGVVVTDW